MKNYFNFFLIFCAAIVFNACSSKQAPINDLKDLVNELRENSSGYSEADWESIAYQLEAIEEAVQENYDQYTDEELKEIGRLEGKCIGLITKKAMKEGQRIMEQETQKAESLLEGFYEGLGEEE